MNALKFFPVVLILTLLLLMCELVSAQTNVYHPFPDSNAVWRVTYGDNQCSITTYYEYTIAGNYVVGNYTYKVIWKRGMEPSGCSSSYIDMPIALVRDDTLKRKWYIISALDTLQEYLLCDFNAQVGDTVHDLYMCGTAVITSIDSVLVGNQYHKKMQHGDYGDAWIEGIGSTRGLIDYCRGGYGVGSNLVCFQQNDSILYSIGSKCDPVNIVEINSRKTGNVLIYPNPVYDVSVLKIEPMEYEYVSLEIYNILGELLRTENIKGLQEISVYKKDFTQGVFIYKLISDKGMNQTGTFIIQ